LYVGHPVTGVAIDDLATEIEDRDYRIGKLTLTGFAFKCDGDKLLQIRDVILRKIAAIKGTRLQNRISNFGIVAVCQNVVVG